MKNTTAKSQLARLSRNILLPLALGLVISFTVQFVHTVTVKHPGLAGELVHQLKVVATSFIGGSNDE